MLFLRSFLAILIITNVLSKKIFKAKDKRQLCPCGSNGYSKHTRVVGGHDAGRGTFPYASCLVNDFFEREEGNGYFQFCGATLITDRHVLTAAHCVKSRTSDEFLIDVGDYALHSSPQGQLRRVRSIKKYKSYVPGKFYSDIAIIELEKPVQWESGVRAAWLPPPNLNLSPGTTVSVYGWGRLNYTGETADFLQSVDLPVITNGVCQEKFKTRIKSKMLCAGGKGGQDACIGDSGSGLVVRIGNEYVLCGLVSFGRRCALPDVAGVYTRVSSYVNWIYKETQSSSCRPCIYGIGDKEANLYKML